MQAIDWNELCAGEFSATATAVTIGVFDGLHAGHRALIRRVVEGQGTRSLVLTFAVHPALALDPAGFGGYLQTRAQTLTRLEAIGVDACVLIDFTERFRAMSGQEFLKQLARAVDLRRLVIGYDFRCGHGPDMNPADIARFFSGSHTAVEIVDPVVLDGHPVSSSRLRRILAEGGVDVVGRLLAAPYTIDLSAEAIVNGTAHAGVRITNGRTVAGMQVLPPPGNYEVELVGDPGASRAATTLTIDENSLRWPLAAVGTIRYIVVHERRTQGESNARNEGAQIGTRC